MIQQGRKWTLTAARTALGLGFFVFGLNGFLHFLPQPPMPTSAAGFVGGLLASGYMFPLIKGTETVAGAFLLAGRFVPLALTVLAPVLVNILAFHLFLAPAGLAVPLVLTALELYLAYRYREVFAPVVAARAAASSPSSGRPSLGQLRDVAA
jgi:uncharacterized membrane protein YphA (DoxX/SURF4 family)